MPKKSKPKVVRTPTRRQLTRWQRERRLQRVFFIATAIVVALVIAIPAFGYYREVIARGQEPIAVVNDKALSLDQYVRLLSFRQYQIDANLSYLSQQTGGEPNVTNQLSQQMQLQRAILPSQVVFDWADGEVMALSAPRLGVSVSPDEVWQEIKRQFFGEPKPDEPVDEAKRDVDAQDQMKRLIDATGITADEYKRLAEIGLVGDRIDKQLKDQIVTPTLQFRVQIILTNGEDTIRNAYERLQGGEDFAAVAKDVSIDTQSKDKGGEVGWVPKGLRAAEFDKTVFAMTPGQTSEPFKSSEGYYIVKVLERDEARDLDAATLDQVKAGALNRWLDEEKTKVKIDYRITSDKQTWAQDKIAKEQAKRLKKSQPAGR